MHPSASRYWHTLRNLKTTQIANRLWRTVYRPRPKAEGSFSLRVPVSKWVEPAYLDSVMRGPHEFEFLGLQRPVRDARDWNEAAWPLLWRYHLHYFDDLNAADFRVRAHWHQALIERWVDENPPVAGVGWDPYPTSLRIVNWIKWWLGGAPASDKVLRSVRVQLARVDSRLEYHLLANHLLENAKALIFGGLFFEDPTADRWLHRGLRILERQLPEQVLEDGGHFERSPMYHQIILASLLDLYNLMGLYGRSERATLLPRIECMLRWSRLMCHPDGEIALFNDAALHEAPTSQDSASYAGRLGIDVPAVNAQAFEAGGVHLESSGYVRVVHGPYMALLNVGSVAPDYQPGHAHADTLSFELSVMGRRLIVDTGTSTYEPGPRRNWERGTAAHNSVVVNGLNSSDVWGVFRVARRARILAATMRSDELSTEVTAAHDGYRYLSSEAVHERCWKFTAEQIQIRDLVSGQGEVDVDLILNIHSAFELVQNSSSCFTARSLDGAVVVFLEMPGELNARIADFSFASRFGFLENGARLVASGRVLLPQRLVTIVRFAIAT